MHANRSIPSVRRKAVSCALDRLRLLPCGSFGEDGKGQCEGRVVVGGVVGVGVGEGGEGAPFWTETSSGSSAAIGRSTFPMRYGMLDKFPALTKCFSGITYFEVEYFL